ncbi:MAG: hypothetical protein A4E55_01907 [Pelotomaculum sp. PtaU1.Bin035]|nr:MAG: hypothetical protein A4E55_01907 [Pelotomaculum sp. PtaU1.Bin035]
MTTEISDKQVELVNSLASTIQDKIMLPAGEKAAIINYSIDEINEKILYLEKALSGLAAAHNRTKTMAVISILGLAILAAIQIIPI